MTRVGSQKCGMRPIAWQGMTLKTCTCSFQWNIACLNVPYMLPLVFFNLCSYRNVYLCWSSVYKASSFHAIWRFSKAAGLPWKTVEAQRAGIKKPRCIGARGSEPIYQSINQSIVSCCLLKPCPLAHVCSHIVCCLCLPFHFVLPLQSVSCCQLSVLCFHLWSVAGSVSFAFTQDYQVIVITISTNFLFKSVYCSGLPAVSLGYSFHSVWCNLIYSILIKIYISSLQ
jgi:hypothetical protein